MAELPSSQIVDPFASIDLECGSVSESQEERLRDKPFIGGPAIPSASFLARQRAALDHPSSPGPAPAPAPSSPPPGSPAGGPPEAAQNQGLGFTPSEPTPAGSTSSQSQASRSRRSGSRSARRRGRGRGSGSAAAASTGGQAPGPSISSTVPPAAGTPNFPGNLMDVIKAFSKKPNRRFEDTDILEVAAMKGIHFPPPSWWRPGGYDPEPKEKN